MPTSQTNKNYYKISTFVLTGIIIVAGLIAGFLLYGNSKLNQGKQLAFSSIYETLNRTGNVMLTDGNITIVLVPIQALDLAKQQTILEIIDTVQKQGYITLFSNVSGNLTEIVLLPYTNPNTR